MQIAINLQAPQAIFFGLLAFELLFFIVNHGRQRPPFNVWAKLADYALFLPLLYWGGFFTQ